MVRALSMSDAARRSRKWSQSRTMRWPIRAAVVGTERVGEDFEATPVVQPEHALNQVADSVVAEFVGQVADAKSLDPRGGRRLRLEAETSPQRRRVAGVDIRMAPRHRELLLRRPRHRQAVKNGWMRRRFVGGELPGRVVPQASQHSAAVAPIALHLTGDEQAAKARALSGWSSSTRSKADRAPSQSG